MASRTDPIPEPDVSDMDPRLVQYLREHCGPHCYGDQTADGIDLTLIRGNLRRSPTERVRFAERHADDVKRVITLARRVHSEPT
jgi:hypothetical protein